MMRNHLSCLGRGVALFLAAHLIIPNLGAAEEHDIVELVRDSGIEHGIIAHLGCGSGERLLDLNSGGRYVVQGLDRDEAKVAAAMSKGFNAFASAARNDLNRLAQRAEPGPIEKGPHYGFIGRETPGAEAWASYRRGEPAQRPVRSPIPWSAPGK